MPFLALKTRLWLVRKPRRRKLLALVAVPLVIVAALFTGVSAASAKTVAVTYGWGTAFYEVENDYYYGSLRDTTTPDGYCVEMQRKTSSGDWVTTGFYTGIQPRYTEEKTISACTTGLWGWHIMNPGAVYGIRLTRSNGSPSTNFCSTKAECRAML